jgi:predicted transcriptional regulator
MLKEGRFAMTDKRFLHADDVARLLEISESSAYRLVRKLNNELEEKGMITIAGKISKRYFEEKVYM